MITVNDCLNRTSPCCLVSINGAVFQHISRWNEVVGFKVITIIVGIVQWLSVIAHEVRVHFFNAAVIVGIAHVVADIKFVFLICGNTICTVRMVWNWRCTSQWCVAKGDTVVVPLHITSIVYVGSAITLSVVSTLVVLSKWHVFDSMKFTCHLADQFEKVKPKMMYSIVADTR